MRSSPGVPESAEGLGRAPVAGNEEAAGQGSQPNRWEGIPRDYFNKFQSLAQDLQHHG